MAPGKTVVTPGVQTLLDGLADWCTGCDQCRYHHDMRWLVDTYQCRTCLGPGVGTPALWVPRWELPDDIGSAPPWPWTWPQLRTAGYVLLTAMVSLVFLASALGACSG